MVIYYQQETQIYRQLLQINNDVWIININGKTAPISINQEGLKQFTVIPADVILDLDEQVNQGNPLIQKRLNIIHLLTEDTSYIIDKPKRLALAKKIAKENNISIRTVLRYFFAYLARGKAGLAPAQRKAEPQPITEDQKNIEKALNLYFYSPNRMTLHMAYEMMLLDYYKTPEGQLNPEHPSYNQFRYFFRKHRNYKKEIVARQGIGDFQKNKRPLTGAGNSGIDYIGLYEIDATVADIYLVSRYDRKPIGRPYVYMAIDVASRLITGLYVGLEGGGNAVLSCISNAAMDKTEFCQQFGIAIRREQWPAQGLPNRICTDRGNDFTSDIVKSLCETYQIEIINLPPYRPDLKGYIEKAFDCLQKRYKPLLHGMGVIEDTATGNGAPDYYAQACLDLEEFTKILIECVLYYNTANILNDFKRTPEMSLDKVRPFAAEVWNWYEKKGKAEITKVNGQSLHLMLLPKAKARFTRFGLQFQWLYYTNRSMEDQFIVKAGSQSEVTVAYDKTDNSIIYLIQDMEYIPFELTLASKRYHGLTEAEMKVLVEADRTNLKEAQTQQLSGRINCNEHILNITKNVKRPEHTKKDLAPKNIKQTREKEKQV